MDRTRTSQPIPLPVTALVALFGALIALAVSNGQAHAHGPAHVDEATHASPLLTRRAVAFRADMRKLWEDHVTWTRLAIISLESGTPDTQATVDRLLRNQDDIGNAVKPFFGPAAGAQLTRLLREHILIAADVIAAAKAADGAKLRDVQSRWVQNADQIAALLNRANARFWKLGALRAELHRHLELTTAEAVARLRGDWRADVAAYDAVHAHALHLSDVLSDGLIRRFPNRFGR